MMPLHLQSKIDFEIKWNRNLIILLCEVWKELMAYQDRDSEMAMDTIQFELLWRLGGNKKKVSRTILEVFNQQKYMLKHKFEDLI